MPETPATWRTVVALHELHRDEAPPFSPDEVATQAGLSVGVVERELDRLARIDAVARVDVDDGAAVRLTDLPVEAAGVRLETLDALSDDEHDALTAALENGTVDPSEKLRDVHAARDAAERALGAREAE